MKTDTAHLFGKLPDAAVRTVYEVLAKVIVPKSDLVFANPFELLVSVALSAHTTDRSVNAATAQLFPIAPDPQKMLALGVEGVKPFLRPVGLYNAKSRNLIEMCRLLIERHGGEVPHDRESLESLPGVGRKTANVVLNIAFGEPTIAVDTHIHRVANRLGIAKTKTPEQSEQVLLARTPKRHVLNAHHYLILHGRYCCIARRPACWRCPVAKQCLFQPKTPKPASA
ncbi:MAG: endonuclease III [Planctomycetes bacterium]|nr:endonuclease III [Planctomycetota bacterium]